MQNWRVRARQHHHAVFTSLDITDDDDVAVKVNILDVQAHARCVKNASISGALMSRGCRIGPLLATNE